MYATTKSDKTHGAYHDESTLGHQWGSSFAVDQVAKLKIGSNEVSSWLFRNYSLRCSLKNVHVASGQRFAVKLGGDHRVGAVNVS